MASGGLVWPQKLLVKKQKLLIFVNHWRTAKSETSDIKNGQVGAIFQFLAFFPLPNWQFQGVNFEWQGHRPLIFFGNFSPINQLDNTHGPSIKNSVPSDVTSISQSLKTLTGRKPSDAALYIEYLTPYLHLYLPTTLTLAESWKQSVSFDARTLKFGMSALWTLSQRL